jgi:hypothetical protein
MLVDYPLRGLLALDLIHVVSNLLAYLAQLRPSRKPTGDLNACGD